MIQINERTLEEIARETPNEFKKYTNFVNDLIFKYNTRHKHEDPKKVIELIKKEIIDKGNLYDPEIAKKIFPNMEFKKEIEQGFDAVHIESNRPNFDNYKTLLTATLIKLYNNITTITPLFENSGNNLVSPVAYLWETKIEEFHELSEKMTRFEVQVKDNYANLVSNDFNIYEVDNFIKNIKNNIGYVHPEIKKGINEITELVESFELTGDKNKLQTQQEKINELSTELAKKYSQKEILYNEENNLYKENLNKLSDQIDNLKNKLEGEDHGSSHNLPILVEIKQLRKEQTSLIQQNYTIDEDLSMFRSGQTILKLYAEALTMIKNPYQTTLN